MTNKFLEKISADYSFFGIDKNMPALADSSGPAPPEWILEGPIYEIFVRNFSVEGTFNAVAENLPYIKDLGIKTIWLMPIHPIGKVGRKGTLGSPYAIQDYYEIDPSLGTKDDFRELVKKVHQNDMRIIIDLVVNHTSNDHVWMPKHPEYFVQPDDNTNIRKAPEWTDITDLNYRNKDLWNKMRRMIRYWVEEFDIDGYRCDVAGLVPVAFWEEVITDLKNIKPDVFMLAEWQSSALQKNAFHATYDWTLYLILKEVRENKRSVKDIIQWLEIKDHLYPQKGLSLLFTENHDFPRTMTEFGNASFYPFTALTYFLKGIPLIYAGQENGTSVLPSLFEKEPIDWDANDEKVQDFYLRMNRLRNEYKAFQKGKISLQSDDKDKVLIIRFDENDKTLYAYLNFSADSQEVPLQGEQAMVGVNLLNGDVFDDIKVTLDPYQVCVLDLVEDDLLMI